MNIGIDTDGVLTDLYAYNYKIGKKILRCEPINPTGYDVREMFGISKRREVLVGLKYFFKYCKYHPPREHASEIIQRLNSEGHELYEITARKFVTMNNPLGVYSRYLLKNWYKKHEMSFADIILCSEKNSPEEKLRGCIQSKCKIMIEDKPDVAKLLDQNGIHVLLFDAPYNQQVEGENITRVYGWGEVYRVIREGIK